VTLPALIARYAAFGVLATLANLAAQRLVLAGGATPAHFAAAVAAGTIVGLVLPTTFWGSCCRFTAVATISS
jgi:hypothetical protein